MNFQQFTSWSSAMVNNPNPNPIDIPIPYNQINKVIDDIIQINVHQINIPSTNHINKIKKNFNTSIIPNNDHNINTSSPSTSKFCQKLIGSSCIALWIILWIAESEIIPLISTDYNKPFFLRYCVGSCMSLMFIIVFIINGFKIPKITWNMLWSSFLMSIIYFLATYCWYISLNSTITAINNTIYECQLVYVYILSIIFLPNYNGSMIKNISVIICILGVIIIGIGSLNDREHDNLHNTTLGIIEVVISSFGYAVLEIMIKYFGDKYFKKNHDENQEINGSEIGQFESVKMMLFMQSMMGLFCFLTFWPGIFMVDWIGIESFELPRNKADIIGIVVACGMDFIWGASFILGISLTNPVLMAMCGLLVIPLTFIVDIALFDLQITSLTIIGCILIILGFTLMEAPIIKFIRFVLEYFKCLKCVEMRLEREEYEEIVEVKDIKKKKIEHIDSIQKLEKSGNYAIN